MIRTRVARQPWFLATALIAVVFNASAQSAGSQQTQLKPQAPKTQAAKVPDWQTAAGGKMEFDVVSIHPIEPDKFMPPNFDTTAGKNWGPNGGLFKADFPVVIYIVFAY